jgi:hypothetical protein
MKPDMFCKASRYENCSMMNSESHRFLLEPGVSSRDVSISLPFSLSWPPNADVLANELVIPITMAKLTFHDARSYFRIMGQRFGMDPSSPPPQYRHCCCCSCCCVVAAVAAVASAARILIIPLAFLVLYIYAWTLSLPEILRLLCNRKIRP